MAEKTDITGQRFNRLLVLGYTGRSNASKKRMVLCKCDCGNEKEMVAANLVSGMAKSCGCLVSESAKERFTKHGGRSHPMYHRWAAMMQRCYDTNDEQYKNYGGRGIKVCDRWRESFWNYAEDVGLPPFPDASIDRVVNDGDYCVGNCRWVSKKEQTLNRRPTKMIEFRGEALCITDWEKKLGFGGKSLWRRLNAGMSVEEAFTMPKIPKGQYVRKPKASK